VPQPELPNPAPDRLKALAGVVGGVTGFDAGMVAADTILLGLLGRRLPERATHPVRRLGCRFGVLLIEGLGITGFGRARRAIVGNLPVEPGHPVGEFSAVNGGVSVHVALPQAPGHVRGFAVRAVDRRVPVVKYRRLGRTELRVSVVGVGTWQLGGEWGQRFTQHDVDQLLGRAGELGVNLIDTAECYGDHLSEAFIGSAISQQRADWVVATKFGHLFHPEAMRQAGRSPVQLRTDHWTPAEVIAQLEASLRALRTDHVDLYQAHSGAAEVVGRDDLWEALHQQVARGKVRHLGVSLGGGDVAQVRRAAEVGVGVVQVGYNRLDRTAEQGVLAACLDQDLGVIVREPLANGYLSGKYRPGAWVTAGDDWRSGHDPAEVQRRLELVEQIGRTEVPEGVAMAAWAIGWCLRHPAVSCVVAGCKSVQQLQSNATAADLDPVRDDHPQAVATR
jgi:myo-inositol catabolism protein IolS